MARNDPSAVRVAHRHLTRCAGRPYVEVFEEDTKETWTSDQREFERDNRDDPEFLDEVREMRRGEERWFEGGAAPAFKVKKLAAGGIDWGSYRRHVEEVRDTSRGGLAIVVPGFMKDRVWQHIEEQGGHVTANRDFFRRMLDRDRPGPKGAAQERAFEKTRDGDTDYSVVYYAWPRPGRLPR